MNKFIIVASGPSALQFKKDFLENEELIKNNCKIIAVNGAIDWIPFCNYFFSLDPSEINLKRVLNKKENVEYHLAHFPRYFSFAKHYLRINNNYKDLINDDSPEYWFKRWGCIDHLQTDKTKISTGNSAYGAINLALHFGAKDVLLYGVDATKDERIEGGFCNSLKHLPLLIKCASKQIKIYSINNNFEDAEKTTIREYINVK